MRFEDITLPSNRKFGFFFTGIFAVVGAYLYYIGIFGFAWGFFGLAGLFFVVTLVKADVLLPLNRLWMRFGFLLGRIVSPIVLGAIFFIIFAPIGILMRLFGRDELRLRQKTANSYWRLRESGRLSGDSLKQQF